MRCIGFKKEKEKLEYWGWNCNWIIKLNVLIYGLYVVKLRKIIKILKLINYLIYINLNFN